MKFKEGYVTLSTLLHMFHLISLIGPPSMSIISSGIVHLISFTMFGYALVTLSFNLIVTFSFQPVPSMTYLDFFGDTVCSRGFGGPGGEASGSSWDLVQSNTM